MSTPSQSKPIADDLLPLFQEMVPVEVVRTLVRSSGKRFYERLFTPLVMLWGFIFQRLNADHTCDAALAYIASGKVDHLDDRHTVLLSQRIKSESTAAYCKGRQRLPLSVLQGVLHQTVQVVQQKLGSDRLWRGHQVSLLDGSTLLLRPEPELVTTYGVHKTGREESYWVVMRVVVAFCLRTAVLLGVAEGSVSESEQKLAKSIFALAAPDTVHVGDRNFGIFSIVQAVRHYEGWVLLRMTRQRARALAGRELRSGADIEVTWRHSYKDQLDPEMSAEPVQGRLAYVRLQRLGFRPVHLHLFTTLLDAERYPLQALVELYGLRWHVELGLRYVKDTLDMALLTAKTSDMVRRELYAGLLAYNLIRGYMVQAAKQANLSPLRLSFSLCWRRVRDVVLSWRPTDSVQHTREQIRRLLHRLAKCLLPKRKQFRIEPRAVRRLPAIYPHLGGSRKEAREHLLARLWQPAES